MSRSRSKAAWREEPTREASVCAAIAEVFTHACDVSEDVLKKNISGESASELESIVRVQLALIHGLSCVLFDRLVED